MNYGPISKAEMTRTMLIGALPILGYIALLAIIFFSSGCAAQKVACKVIDVADDVCTILEYVGEDGKKHQVAVPKSELEGFARMTAARQAAADRADAGAK